MEDDAQDAQGDPQMGQRRRLFFFLRSMGRGKGRCSFQIWSAIIVRSDPYAQAKAKYKLQHFYLVR